MQNEETEMWRGAPNRTYSSFILPSSIENGCRGWNRTSIRAFKGRCPTIRRPGNELVEPEVVATSPYRIKSPVPVCCGFDSMKLVGERGLAPPRLTDSRSVGSAVPGEPHARFELELVAQPTRA